MPRALYVGENVGFEMVPGEVSTVTGAKSSYTWSACYVLFLGAANVSTKRIVAVSVGRHA